MQLDRLWERPEGSQAPGVVWTGHRRRAVGGRRRRRRRRPVAAALLATLLATCMTTGARMTAVATASLVLVAGRGPARIGRRDTACCRVRLSLK